MGSIERIIIINNYLQWSSLLVLQYMNNFDTVVVGLSGGVDSSVAAYLLQQQGYRVIGLFMRNWHDESVVINKECPWIDDSNDAMLVAEKLGIPFQVLDLSKEYKERIVDYMFAEYQAGRTPNPDVLCNREIKFDVFLKAAKKLGANFVATGHYCRKTVSLDVEGKSVYHLLAGKDLNKDQSYFLCQLDQEQLASAIFPIGDMQKSEVRDLAKELNLVTADKKDSQGLCFVGKVKLPVFLQQQLEPKIGSIIEVPNDEKFFGFPQEFESEDEMLHELTAAPVFDPSIGFKVAEHQGAHFYTVGQRKGLNIGGRPLPSFAVGIDVVNNIVFSGMGEDHLALKRPGLFINRDDIHWINPKLEMKIGEKRKYSLRIRYRQQLFTAVLYQREEGLYVIFDQPQKAVAPGQFAVWYDGDELIGSGVIA